MWQAENVRSAKKMLPARASLIELADILDRYVAETGRYRGISRDQIIVAAALLATNNASPDEAAAPR